MNLTWPDSWGEDRRKVFADRLRGMGLAEQAAPVAAGQIHALGVDEEVFIDYLILARVSQEKAAEYSNIHVARMRPLLAIIGVMLHRGWRLVITLPALLVMIIPLLLIATPFRIQNWWRMRGILRNLPPTFAQYVARKRGVLTAIK